MKKLKLIYKNSQISFFDKPKIKLLEDWTRLYPLLTKNSVWKVDESNFRCIGADIRLIEDVEGSFTWLEIPKERLEDNFELIQ